MSAVTVSRNYEIVTPGHIRNQLGIRPGQKLQALAYRNRTSQSQRAGFPLTHELQKTKLPKRSWVKISQIRSLSTERIGRKIGRIDANELAQVIEGLNEIIAG